jgi:hypothetical protein
MSFGRDVLVSQKRQNIINTDLKTSKLRILSLIIYRSFEKFKTKLIF